MSSPLRKYVQLARTPEYSRRILQVTRAQYCTYLYSMLLVLLLVLWSVVLYKYCTRTPVVEEYYYSTTVVAS
jgi:hypothetical protein